ncbi:MAG: CotH kinase family protein [Lewinellaceae bacterium]|nr:CotH kinase family protein [Lewinellaceae bacterium]
MKKIAFLLGFFFPAWGFAQVFTGTGGVISDVGTHSYYTIAPSGLPAVIDAGFGLEAVCVNILHPNVSDLIISLISPDGKEVELTSRNGGDGDNFTNTCFNSQAPIPIYLGWPPYQAWYEPEGFLSLVNNGQDPNGIWTLHIFDAAPFSNAGQLLDWSLEFGIHPSVPFNFSQSTLPIVLVSTNGAIIPNEPKIMAQMKVIDNGAGQLNHTSDSANVYDGWIGIEVRGRSSAWMPKKSYGLETRNADSTGLDVSLLGMPEEEDWVLIGNYSDKSLLRNYYAYYLYRKMGHWAPRMRFCDLVIDGEYQGIYLLGERIKRDGDRVDIASIDPAATTGEGLTGGYIFKNDWEDPGDVGWTSNYPPVNAGWGLRYLFVYPKSEDVQPAQIAYLKSYVDSFEVAMKSSNFAHPTLGYRRFADTESFIDYIILTELTKNIDGYRLSTYFHKDKNEKIKAGPPWDYDLSWGNADYAEGSLTYGWNYQIQANYSNQLPFWWLKFFEDTPFKNDLKCRWLELREELFDPLQIRHDLDSLAAVLAPSINLNFKKWPILGLYVWPNPSPIPENYDGEVYNLKNWIHARINWLDTHWTGTCPDTGVGSLADSAGLPFEIFPNPSSGNFSVEVAQEALPGEIVIRDVHGRQVFAGGIHEVQTHYSPGLLPGVYFLTFRNATGLFTRRLIVE